MLDLDPQSLVFLCLPDEPERETIIGAIGEVGTVAREIDLAGLNEDIFRACPVLLVNGTAYVQLLVTYENRQKSGPEFGCSPLFLVLQTESDLPAIKSPGTTLWIQRPVHKKLLGDQIRSAIQIQAERLSLTRRIVDREIALTSIDEVFFSVDYEFRYTFFNKKSQEIRRVSHKEVLGKVMWELFPDLINTEFHRQMYAAARDRKNKVFEFLGPFTGDWFETRIYPSSAGLSVFLLKITDRKKMEEALVEVKARLEATLTATEVATWTWDVVNDRVLADQNLTRFFGVTEPIPGGAPIRLYLDAIHPEDRDRVEKTIAASLVSETGYYEADFRLTPVNGIERWIVARGMVERDASGKPIRFPGVVIDLTERKRAEEAVRASEERFRLLADNISQLIWMSDAKGKGVWYNRRWFDFTGKTLEQIQGDGWAAIHHPEHFERVTSAWDKSVLGGSPWEDHFPLLCQDGNYRWFLARAIPIRDASGTIMSWFGTHTDITELREVQEALNTATAELSHQNQILEETVNQRTEKLREVIAELESFSYSISHDMRAPLRAMQGYSEALLQDYADKLDADGIHYLERINRGATRLDSLIRDVLAYSKVSRQDVQLTVLDLNALITELLQDYPHLQPAKIRVSVSPLPPVLANQSLMSQIISNLLGNALKFATPGRFPEVKIWAEKTGTDVKIWFQDNGIGIAPQHHEQIFQIYGRIYQESQYEGTGIGLAIVRRAVERMGGTVGVESEIGAGSRFWICLREAPVP